MTNNQTAADELARARADIDRAKSLLDLALEQGRDCSFELSLFNRYVSQFTQLYNLASKKGLI